MQAPLIQQGTGCSYPPSADAGSSVADAAADGDATPGDAAGARPDAAPLRAPLSGSKCWTITYTPVTSTDWAGVDWQYPANNWGAIDGLVIPAGAKKVSLVAWGEAGGEKVSFNVGYGAASNDRFTVSSGDRFLTTTPTVYAVDVTGIPYTCSSVRMGFGWIAAGGTTITFHLADIRWE
jgi:hypothetical protein